MVEPDTKAMFQKHGIYTATETEANYKIALEAYVKTINIEAQLTADIARTLILPAALTYQADVAGTLAATKQAAPSADASAPEKCLKIVAGRTGRLHTALDNLDDVRSKADHAGADILKHAGVYRDQVKPAMNEVRVVADQLEWVVDDKYWPIPKYREMLFMM
jgi:glutamine synthetase